jgi:Bacteriophage lambda head decoration protein D
MVLIVNSVGDNPQQPSITAETYIPDQLIAGPHNLVTQPIVLAAGSSLPRGTVLGQQTSFSVIATPGTNTGNGTVGSVSAGSTAQTDITIGEQTFGYLLTATSATTFTVQSPEEQTPAGGAAMPNATVGTAYNSGGIAFTIAAGGTAFAAGDTFVLNVSDSIGNFITSVKTATDGSQVPSAILADFADATNGPVTTGAYIAGEFNVNAINFDSSWTPELLQTSLRAFAIYLKGSVTAIDPVNDSSLSTQPVVQNFA